MQKKMNNLLADLVVFYHKLQSFHWYVSGHTFFQSHAQLEGYYDGILPQIDELAELILMTGGKPLANLKEFSEHSKIAEVKGEYVNDIKGLFSSLLADFKYLLDSSIAVKEAADSENNHLVSAKMDDFISGYSKVIWMISQAAK